MTIIEWLILDTRRKIAAEEGGAAAEPPTAAASSPVSIRGTIDTAAGRNFTDGPAKRERYQARKAGRV